MSSKKLFRISLFTEDTFAEKVALFAAYSNGENENLKADLNLIFNRFDKLKPDLYFFHLHCGWNTLTLNNGIEEVLQLEEVEVMEVPKTMSEFINDNNSN